MWGLHRNEDGSRACSHCAPGRGCLSQNTMPNIMNYTCPNPACRKCAMGLYDEHVVCLYCSTPVYVEKARSRIHCLICGPDVAYFPLCYGYTDPSQYPPDFTCGPAHQKEHEERLLNSTNILIYGVDERFQHHGLHVTKLVWQKKFFANDAGNLRDHFKMPEYHYLCDAMDHSVVVSVDTRISDFIGAPQVVLMLMQDDKGKEEEQEQEQEESSDLVVFDGENDAEKMIQLEKYAEAARQQIEYDEVTGLFLDTPISTAHGCTFPGMAILQEGEASTRKKNVSCTVAICLCKTESHKLCSTRLFIGVKAIKQHTTTPGHLSIMRRQGVNDGETYMLECQTCPVSKSGGYKKAQACWPWTHEHYNKIGDTTTVRMHIESPEDVAAEPFLPVVDQTSRATTVPWLQSVCGLSLDTFPDELVAEPMRCVCVPCDKTPAVVFSHSGSIPSAFTEEVRRRYMCPQKFTVNDDDEWHQLICVPCANVQHQSHFLEIGPEERLAKALNYIEGFDIYGLKEEELFVDVVKSGEPRKTFKIPPTYKPQKKMARADSIQLLDESPLVDPGPSIVLHLTNAYKTAEEANMPIDQKWFVGAPIAYIQTHGGFKKASKIDVAFFHEKPTNRDAVLTANLFVSDHLLPIIHRFISSGPVYDDIRKALVWAFARLLDLKKTNSFEGGAGMFTTMDSSFFTAMLYESFRNWTLLIKGYIHMKIVRETILEEQRNKMRMSGRIVMSDHYDFDPEEPEEPEEELEDDEEDSSEEDTFNSSSSSSSSGSSENDSVYENGWRTESLSNAFLNIAREKTEESAGPMKRKRGIDIEREKRKLDQKLEREKRQREEELERKREEKRAKLRASYTEENRGQEEQRRKQIEEERERARKRAKQEYEEAAQEPMFSYMHDEFPDMDEVEDVQVDLSLFK